MSQPPGQKHQAFSSRPRLRAVAVHAATFLACFVLVAYQTWPLVRHPSGLVAQHHDPWLFDWVMLSAFQNALTDPTALLQGRAFYPLGTSLAYSEPLLVPALLAGPLFQATGDPLFAYNWTLLIFWAASGWAMYATAYRLTRRHAAAAVSAIVFTICSYRMDYYLEFQMEIVLGIPLAFYFLIRWLEQQRVRDLAGLLVTMAAQAMSVWYYTIITALGLAVVAVHFVALRWRGWRWRAAAWAALGLILLAAVVAPLAEPYFQVRRELGVERDLDETGRHSADVLTYFETTRWTRLYRFSPTLRRAESPLFMGFVALALAGASLGWLWARGTGPRTRRWQAGAWVGVAVAMIAVSALVPASPNARETPAVLAMLGVAAWVALLAGHLREGWRRWSDHNQARTLDDRDLVRLLVAVALVGFLLSLGPYVHVGGQEVGQGPYAWLHPFVLPLHAIRVASRIGVLVVFSVALLAGLGFKWLLDRRPARQHRLAIAGVLLAMFAEYSVSPLPFDRTTWQKRSPVYGALASMRNRVTVAEVPMSASKPETRRMLYSLSYPHYLVNGFSGFAPGVTRGFADAMSLGPVGGPGTDEAWAERQRLLQSLHPSPHLLVHRGEMAREVAQEWKAIASMPWARLVGSFGRDELYAIDERQQGIELERMVSWQFARRKTAVSFRITAPPAAGIRRWLDVEWNGQLLSQVELGPQPYATTLPLRGPLRRVAANRLRFTCRYVREAQDPLRAQVGTTQTVVPVDLELIGARQSGQAHIRVNGIEKMPPMDGYLVVVLSPSGELVARAGFDIERVPGETQAFARFVGGAAPGTIVAVVTAGQMRMGPDRHVASGLVAIGAWPTAANPKNMARAIVGVRGAAVGTALDVSALAWARATVGGASTDGAVVLERLAFEH